MKKRKRKNRAKPRSRSKSASQQALSIASPARTKDKAAHPLISHTILWIGSVLTAFTFLGGLQTVIDYSPWASWFLANWLHFTETFWKQAFQLFGVDFHRDGVITATFIFSMLFMGVGAMFLGERHEPPPKTVSFREALLGDEASVRRVEGMAVGCTIALAAISVINWQIFDSSFRQEDLHFWWLKWVLIVVTPILYVFLFLNLSRGDFFHVILLTVSMTSLYVAMLIPAANAAKARGNNDLWALAFMVVNLSAVMFPSKMMTIVSFAWPRFWNYRMLYVWLTIALVLILDWVARSSISLKPPM